MQAKKSKSRSNLMSHELPTLMTTNFPNELPDITSEISESYETRKIQLVALLLPPSHNLAKCNDIGTVIITLLRPQANQLKLSRKEVNILQDTATAKRTNFPDESECGARKAMLGESIVCSADC